MKSIFLIGIFFIRQSAGTPCGANEYVKDVNTCDPCTNSKTHYTIQNKNCGDYSKCEEGFCAAGEHASGSGGCNACAGDTWTIYGSYSAKALTPGDSASCSQCKQNYKLVGGQCQGCELGKSHMAGDTTGTCDDTQCPAGMMSFGASGRFGCANCWGSSTLSANPAWQISANPAWQMDTTNWPSAELVGELNLSYGNSYANPYGGSGSNQVATDIPTTDFPFQHHAQGGKIHVGHWLTLFKSGTSANNNFGNLYMGKNRSCNNCKVGTYFSLLSHPASSNTIAGGLGSRCLACSPGRWNYGVDFSVANIAGQTKSSSHSLECLANGGATWPNSPDRINFGNYGIIATHQDCSFCAPNFHYVGPDAPNLVGQCESCQKGKSNLFGGYLPTANDIVVPFRHSIPTVPVAAAACVEASCAANWKLTGLSGNDMGGCKRCDSGKTMAAGSNSSTISNTCGTAICGPNEHVTTDGTGWAQCEQCPVGYGNASGDNALLRRKGGKDYACKNEDPNDEDNFLDLDGNSGDETGLKFSSWSKPLWKATEPWYTHCDGCAANYHVQADTHACVTCDSGKSSSPAANRWLAATECQQVATTVDDDSTGVLIGAVCGGIAGVALLGVAAYCCKKKRT